MKKLLLLSQLVLLFSCKGPKTPYTGKVVRVHWNQSAEVSTQTKTGKDTIIYCYPTSKYQSFKVGQELTVFCNKYSQTTQK